MLGGLALLLLLLHLSIASPASLKDGRPDRPPLIWKWLSDALGTDKDEAMERVDPAEKATYVEELAEAGFNMTGIYISPHSIINPLKWVQLLQEVLPGPEETAAALRNLSPATRTASVSDYTEATGNLAAKHWRMALSLLCFTTDIAGKIAGTYYKYTDVEDSIDIIINGGFTFEEKKNRVRNSQLWDIGLFAVCNGIKIIEVADSYGSSNCKQNSDCGCKLEPPVPEPAKCVNYVCNLHRGVCERPQSQQEAVVNKCTEDKPCKEACGKVCKARCSVTKEECNTGCENKPCEAATSPADCETEKNNCKRACVSTETTCMATGCNAKCANYFCNLARGDCDRS